MQIDWFTLVAQLINFLALVWLLKRFLYKPILDAIDAREERIAKSLEEAANTQKEASTERDKLSTANAELEAQAAQLLQDATEAATQQRNKLLKEAHAEAEEIGHKRRQDQQQELEQLHGQIYQLTLTEVLALTRKLLAELANTTLEQSVVDVFIVQLQAMSEESRKELTQALTTEPAGGVLCSAFTLDEALQEQLQTTIDEWADAKVPLKFETNEQLLCGIELTAKGLQSTWNVAAYLQALQDSLSEQLSASTPTESVEQGNA